MQLKAITASVLLAMPLALIGPAASAQDAVPIPAAKAGAQSNGFVIDTVDRIVAVVGSSVITWSDLAAAVNEQRAAGLKLPDDPAGQLAIGRTVLNSLVDQEILIQKAKDVSVDVTDAEVTPQVDRQIKDVRSHFQSEVEYRAELKNAGFGSPEEYRRTLMDQFRRRALQQKTFVELRKRAKPASISEEEVTAAFDKVKDALKDRPAMITFRQIVVAPHASRHADSLAHAKADSILAELKKGADFAEMAKRESMDPGTKNLGGDLGWYRRGGGPSQQAFVPNFEAMLFALRPGELSPVFKTVLGYHIIRVDRVEPAEVRGRHILIIPKVDSNDVHTALLRADTVEQLWRRGVAFDTLVARYHDIVNEEKGLLQPYPIDSLPPIYQKAVAGLDVGDVTKPFPLSSPNGVTKYAVLRLVTLTKKGEYSIPEERAEIRAHLAAEKQARTMLDDLRKQTYVSLRL